MKFEIVKKSKKSKARLGILKTSNGEVQTPCFVPVATQATIKTLDSEEALQTKSQVLICNTFHLHLKPNFGLDSNKKQGGERIVRANGGLHKFMNWPRPLMTDSGGFQVFSLGFGMDLGVGKILKEGNKNKEVKKGVQPTKVKITDEGVYFRSPIDGRKLFLGPKESIKIQEALGADIIFAFDECTPPTANYEYTKNSLLKTHKWAEICQKTLRTKQALYGIVQGGKFQDLRIQSSKFIASINFDGFGIGGEFGDDKNNMVKMLRVINKELPEQKPRHLLGIGYLEDMKKIIKEGIDTFDCIVPTHYARRGIAFVNIKSPTSINLSRSIFLKNKGRLDKNCHCYVCQNYTRSYICHLLRAKEITPLKLLTFHNLYFFNTFVENIREEIKQGRI